MRYFLPCLLLTLLFGCDIKRTKPPIKAEFDDALLYNEPSGEDIIPERNEKRYAWQKPEFVIDLLGQLDDQVVADIGAGTGYFAFRLVSKAEKVIAVDIDPNMIDLMELFKDNLDTVTQAKIDMRLATPDDPQLQEEEVDVVIIINTIGYIDERVAYLQNLIKSLKPEGFLFIVDFKMKRIPDDIAPSSDFRVNMLELEEDLMKSGFETVDVDDKSLDYQYIVKAFKPSS